MGATKRPWCYVGDVVVGVVAECDCPPAPLVTTGSRTGALVAFPELPHESHDVVKPVMEDELPEGMTLAAHQANCRLIALAVNAYADLLAACECEAEILRNELEGLSCAAGNPDGGTAAGCEHCQLTERLKRLDAAVALAEGR